VAFHKIRQYIVHFKSCDLDRIQAILIAIFVFFGTLVALILYQRIRGFSNQINDGTVYLMTVLSLYGNSWHV